MAFSWYTVLTVWVALWAVLYFLSEHSGSLTLVSIGLVAGHLADWILKAVQHSKKTTFIKDVTSKAVFITGCDTGFGFDLARKLGEMGFKVYAGCLNPDGEGPTSLKLMPHRIVVIPCDVTKEQEVLQAYSLVEDDLEENETLWAVVNNAGIASFTEIEWCSLSTYRKLLEVNALGPVLVTKTFLPLLRRGGGRVVIVASLAGRYTFPGFSGYSMSKHAAVSFADGLRLEMKKWNISVHTVEPTLYKTPITNVELLQKNLDQYWEESPPEVRRSYGLEYLKEFKGTVSSHMSKAKPREKIKEVVDDMVAAVAGTEPRTRYVPSVETQIKERVLSTLPLNIRDEMFLKGQPSSPPAFIAEELKRKPSLVDPRRPKTAVRMSRHYSVPNYEKAQITPPPSKSAVGTKFSFDNILESQ